MMFGLFGACLFMYGMPIRRKGLYGFVIFLIVCMAGVFWLTDGKLEAVEQAKKDMVYRKFVYDNYTKADVGLLNSINKIFWEDYKVKSDGIYSALTQVRIKLKEQYRYTKTPGKTPEGQDPLQRFLTTSRTGNQMLYASAAVEAFRTHGIPARYVEGYYLGASKIQDSKNGEVSITGENAHAWVEVYFDGVGWKTKEMDKKITDHFANIEAGEYERACELVEKTIYGEIKLELFEERTVRNFRDKLAEEAKGLAWKEKLKLRYQFQKYCM